MYAPADTSPAAQWLPEDHDDDPYLTTGLIHKAPRMLRMFIMFLQERKQYLLLLVLLVAAIIATLISADPRMDAGYMVLLLVLALAFNFVMVKFALYEIDYNQQLSERPSRDSTGLESDSE